MNEQFLRAELNRLLGLVDGIRVSLASVEQLDRERLDQALVRLSLDIERLRQAVGE